MCSIFNWNCHFKTLFAFLRPHLRLNHLRTITFLFLNYRSVKALHSFNYIHIKHSQTILLKTDFDRQLRYTIWKWTNFYVQKHLRVSELPILMWIYAVQLFTLQLNKEIQWVHVHMKWTISLSAIVIEGRPRFKDWKKKYVFGAVQRIY